MNDFLRKCCKSLNLNEITLANAFIYVNTFHEHLKDRNIDEYLIYSSCLFLAAKTTEDPRKLRDIINVAYKILVNSNIVISEEYWKIRDSIISCELILLRFLGFKTRPTAAFVFLAQYFEMGMEQVDEKCTKKAFNTLLDW